mgnify:CR=1 FL=1
MVVNDYTPSASERCAATDEICVKGVRGCFPDKRFISSCVIQGLINHARVGTAVPSLPRFIDFATKVENRNTILSCKEHLRSHTFI